MNSISISNYSTARDYDPVVGRWLQRDPIKFEGGDTNLYAYVGNDPVNYVDPSGQAAVAPLLPIVIIPIGLIIGDYLNEYRQCYADPEGCQNQRTIDEMQKNYERNHLPTHNLL